MNSKDVRVQDPRRFNGVRYSASFVFFDKSTPVGFEPTRAEPIGLAGRRLSRSAKVSLHMERFILRSPHGANDATHIDTKRKRECRAEVYTLYGRNANHPMRSGNSQERMMRWLPFNPPQCKATCEMHLYSFGTCPITHGQNCLI